VRRRQVLVYYLILCLSDSLQKLVYDLFYCMNVHFLLFLNLGLNSDILFLIYCDLLYSLINMLNPLQKMLLNLVCQFVVEHTYIKFLITLKII